MHRLTHVEMIGGGAAGITAVAATTKSVIYYKIATFGEYHIDVATIIAFVSFIAVVDGFRRAFKSSRSNRKKGITYLDDE